MQVDFRANDDDDAAAFGAQLHASAFLYEDTNVEFSAKVRKVRAIPSSALKRARGVLVHKKTKAVGGYVRRLRRPRCPTLEVVDASERFWILSDGSRAKKSMENKRYVFVPKVGPHTHEGRLLQKTKQPAVGDLVLARAKDDFNRARRAYLYSQKRLTRARSKLEDYNIGGRVAMEKIRKRVDVPERVKRRVRKNISLYDRLSRTMSEIEKAVDTRRQDMQNEEREIIAAERFQWSCERPFTIWGSLVYSLIRRHGYRSSPMVTVVANPYLYRHLSVYLSAKGAFGHGPV